MMKLLIVEDHVPTAMRLAALLRKAEADLQIVHAYNLADGLRLSVEVQADVTLLDLLLPDVKDWHETVAAIHKFVPPVIVVTDLDDPEIKAACLKAGCENVFEKRTVFALAAILVAASATAKMRRMAKEGHEIVPARS